ncbi:hypothetical protein GN956_G3299 [Arapaima gigas]
MFPIKQYKTEGLSSGSNVVSRLSLDAVSCQLAVKTTTPKSTADHKGHKAQGFQSQTAKNTPKQTEDSTRVKIYINLCPVLAAVKTQEEEDSDYNEPGDTVKDRGHCGGSEMNQMQQLPVSTEQQAANQQGLCSENLRSDIAKVTSLPAICKPYQKYSSHSSCVGQSASPYPLPLINLPNQGVLPIPSSMSKTHGIIKPFPKLLQQHSRSQLNSDTTVKMLSRLQLPDDQGPSVEVLLEKVRESVRKWEKEKVGLACVNHLSLAGALQSLREGLVAMQDSSSPFLQKMARSPGTGPSRCQEMNISMPESALNNYRLAVQGKQPVIHSSLEYTMQRTFVMSLLYGT